MMTPEQIAAMRADADAGTPGPWTLVEENGDFYYWHMLDASGNDFMGDKAYYPWQSLNEADRKRFQRVPDMEATIIAQAAEIERLNDRLLSSNANGMPWLSGSPIDTEGMYLIQCDDEFYIVVWDVRQGYWSVDHEWWVSDNKITRHVKLRD